MSFPRPLREPWAPGLLALSCPVLSSLWSFLVLFGVDVDACRSLASSANICVLCASALSFSPAIHLELLAFLCPTLCSYLCALCVLSFPLRFLWDPQLSTVRTVTLIAHCSVDNMPAWRNPIFFLLGIKRRLDRPLPRGCFAPRQLFYNRPQLTARSKWDKARRQLNQPPHIP